MSNQLPQLEKIFPELAATGYSPKSEKSAIYNCIAYAAGDETKKWEGYREVGYFWPEGAKEGHGIEALRSAFEQLQFAICTNDALESDYEKIALYLDKDGLWTHAAKQCEDGQWTSKIGNLEDIIHRTPQSVAGPDPAYGQVACFMKRKKRATGSAPKQPQTEP